MVEWKNWDKYEDNFKKCSQYKSVLIYGNKEEKGYDISILIPTFKRSNTLKQALESALNQNQSIKYNIIVVDNYAEIDNETDELMRQYCEEYQNILYYRNETNMGIVGNWNRCIELCTGKWMCMLHDDDLLKPEFLTAMVRIINKENVGICGSYRELLDERVDKRNQIGYHGVVGKGIELYTYLRKQSPIRLNMRDVAYSRHFPCNPYMINKKYAIEIGGFSHTFLIADLVFPAIMIKKYGACMIPDKLAICRFSQNESTKKEMMQLMIEYGSKMAEKAAIEISASKRFVEKRRQEAVIIEYNIFPNLKSIIDFQEVYNEYNLDNKYKFKLMQKIVILKYYIGWGMTFFRK